MSPNDSFSQHVVTAVIVAHDGAAWLPHLIDALGEQTRPVQRVVAVDTGSRDRSGSVLTARLGQGAVFGMDRSTGYAAAVRRAVQHKAASAPVAEPGRGRAGQVEWLWLLHDDCEPAADALEQLLRGAAETPTAAVLGPKLMDWANRDIVAEAGVALDTAGRRITGVEPREVDQGQHDGDRDVMAVCSAGMLVRRDVWEQEGGFDPGMALFGEDIDFCWRVHAAGFRVRVITDAVLFHVAAATRNRRAISVGRRARLLDRRNNLITLLGNLPAARMLASLAGNLALSLLRTVFYLVAKRPTAALDESAAVAGFVGRPLRLARARRLRARGRRAAYGALRADLQPGHSIRRAAEFTSTVLSRTSRQDLAGAHHATDDPDDDESLLTDSGVLQRMLTRPGVLLLIGLIAVAIAAERSVITSGTLGGGALLPAWEGASSLWGQFLQAYHPSGVGSASAGPPYVGLVALLATILLGKAWLAVDVLLLSCVPLAGVTAFFALRRVTLSVPVRVWAAASYALLPVAFGAISAGRLGTAVAFVLIPVIGMLAGRMCTQPPRIARRAAWATGLAVTVGTAFVPILWPITVVGAVLAALTLRRAVASLLPNLGIVVLTPLVLLLPWLLELLPHPSRLLLEAGLAQPGLADAKLPARSLLLLSPGGPGLPPYWVSAGLVLVGLAALLATRRFRLVVAGWCVALIGFGAALLASKATVLPADGQPVTAWPGVALAVAAAGLLLAGAAAADSAGRALSAGGRTGISRFSSARGLPVTVLALLACTAPLLAGAYWLMNGVSGPIGPAGGEVVPSIVSTTAAAGRQLRTLVLAPATGGKVSFLLLRGDSPQFSSPDVTPVPAAQAALTRTVADLVAPNGGEAVDQSQQLARFGIGFVLMRRPVDAGLASILDDVTGLTEVSMTSSFDLWRLTILPSRVSVLESSGAVVPVTSGAIGVSGATVPAAGGTLLLAEPAGGWTASVNGHSLTPVVSPAGSWAQAFRLPPGGGTLTVSRNGLVHDLVMALELLAFLIVAALALPGIRSAAEIEAAAVSAAAVGSTSDGVAAAGDGEPGEEPERVLAGAGRRGAGRRAASTVLGSRAAGSRVAGSTAGAARAGAGATAAGPVGAGVAGAGWADTAATAVGPVRAGSAAAGASAAGQPRGQAAAAEAGRSRRGSSGRSRIGSRGKTRRGDAPRPGDALAERAGSTAAAAAGSGAAAGSAAAASAATAGGGRLRGRRRGSDSRAAATSDRPGTAWPAGQPVSRFVSGPPEEAVASADRGRRASGYVDAPDGAVTSADRGRRASGYVDPPGYADSAGYPGAPGSPGYAGRRGDVVPAEYPETRRSAPSGYRDEYGGYESGNSDRGSRRQSYDDGSRGQAYGGRDYDSAGYDSASGAGRDSGASRGYPARDARSDPYDYPDQPDYQQAGYGSQGGQSGPGASWASDERASSWPTAGRRADRSPGDQQPGGWRSDDQRAWPADAESGRPGSSWPVPGQGDALEALPPADEVHHDWPRRNDRPAHGWPAPDGEDEGEDW